jgi:hypothetical protein
MVVDMTEQIFKRVDFALIAQAALNHSDTICRRWLPDGQRQGHEWVARNPRRSDKRRGSFKVNLASGKWGDFASGDRGGDLISLGAYLHDLDQRQAAIRIAEMLGVDPYVK